jgi:hypothetical protein
MSTDRPDLPTFDGRDVREHASAAAEAIRAINHITGWPRGMTYPSDAYSVVSRLTTVAAMLPQAFRQIDSWITEWHAAGRIGIDRGQLFADDQGEVVAVAVFALAKAGEWANALHGALDTAANVLSAAHWTGPDPYIAIVDDRGPAAHVWTAPYPAQFVHPNGLRGTVYHATCERCDWSGSDRQTEEQAQSDADAHSCTELADASEVDG